MTRLLLIEDDTVTAEEVAGCFRGRGYQVAWAATGTDGLAQAGAGEADVLVVDRLLPGLDGLALIEALRHAGIRTPALVLSALDERVRGLRAGGGDYLGKPFALAELVARIEALLRGTLLAQRGERRIAAVHEALGRIMQGHLQERLPTRGTAGELDKVTAAVNGMLDRIEQLVEEIRGVGDSIARDLRTPLTRVRTRLERSRDEAVTREEFQTAADRAIASVDQAGLLRDAAELYEPVAEEKGVALRLRLAAGSTVPGDRDLLLEAVGNLLDNAVKFTPAGTDVTLSLYGGPNGACIRVADNRPGILPSEGQRPRAEPGRRGRLAAWFPPADRRQRGRLRRRDRLLSRRRAGPGAGGPAFDAGRPAGPGKLTAGPPAYIGISQSLVQRGPTRHGARCLLSISRRGPPCLPTHRPPIEC